MLFVLQIKCNCDLTKYSGSKSIRRTLSHEQMMTKIRFEACGFGIDGKFECGPHQTAEECYQSHTAPHKYLIDEDNGRHLRCLLDKDRNGKECAEELNNLRRQRPYGPALMCQEQISPNSRD